MAIYMLFDGIKGNVTAEGYKDHVAIKTLNFGVGRSISMEPGNLSNREASRPTISEITLTKEADNSATSFFKEAVTGAQGKKVKIKFVQTGADKVVEYMDYELENCMVSGYSISADGDSDPYETISLSFSQIMINYNDFDSNNSSGSPQRVGYCLETAVPM